MFLPLCYFFNFVQPCLGWLTDILEYALIHQWGGSWVLPRILVVGHHWSVRIPWFLPCLTVVLHFCCWFLFTTVIERMVVVSGLCSFGLGQVILLTVCQLVSYCAFMHHSFLIPPREHRQLSSHHGVHRSPSMTNSQPIWHGFVYLLTLLQFVNLRTGGHQLWTPTHDQAWTSPTLNLSLVVTKRSSPALNHWLTEAYRVVDQPWPRRNTYLTIKVG